MFQTEPDLPFSIKLADKHDTKGRVIKGKEQSFATGEELHDWYVRNSYTVSRKRFKTIKHKKTKREG